MTHNHLARTGCILLLLASAGARAEQPADGSVTGLFPRDFLIGSSSGTATVVPRPNRVALFRIAPAFLTDPVALDADDSGTDDPASVPQADDGPSWLEIAVGNDNPLFELRRPGDPGGIGYYRLHSQVQLIDSPTTGCTLNVKAFTPAGRESNGVADGPTYISPAFSFFQTLDDNLALQAFVGKNVRVDTPLRGPFASALECGVGLQRPVLDGLTGPGRLFVSVEALGRYRYDTTTDRPTVLEMVPGLHWRMNENLGVSGGWSMPLSVNTGGGQWQITCWMHF